MSIGELISLGLRCSVAESVREQCRRHLALINAKKSPPSDAPRTVCIIAENPVWGGTERHTRQLIDALMARGFHIKLVTARTNLPNPELAAIDSIAFEWIPVPLSIHDRADREAWLRLLRRIKAYVVILPCPRIAFGSFAFLSVLRRSFSKVIYIAHASPNGLPEGLRMPTWLDLFSGDGRANWIERLRRSYRMRCADHIVAVSEEARGQLINMWQARPARVATVHNGVAGAVEPLSPTQRSVVCQRLGIAPDAFVFGMVTRLSPEKGVDLAIRALASLDGSPAKRGATLVIAGEGPLERKLRDLADQLGVADRVVWLGFVTDPAEVYGVLDAILLPSHEEGLPLALLEAMRAGVIPIASAVGGIPEVIRDSALGRLVPPDDSGALASAMRQVMALTPAERAAWSQRLPPYIADNFDAEVGFDRIVCATGLNDDETWRARFWLSKTVRDPIDAWIDFAKLWWYAHRPAEDVTRRPASVGPDTTSPTKPAVCVLEHSQGWGGAENHTFLLIEHLRAAGFPLEYICGKESTTSPPAGINILQAPIDVFDDAPETEAAWMDVFVGLRSRVLLFPALDVEFGRSLAFMKAVRKSFDRIIYIEHTLPPPMPARTRKRYLGGLVPGYSVWWHRERLRRKLRMRCPTRIIAVSDAVRQHFIDLWACPPRKIVTIRNGVDCDRFTSTPQQRIETRRVHGIPTDALVFGIVARLSQEKGVDLAVRAFAAFRAARPACDAYLVAAGDGPEAESLRALGEELKVADRVRWLGFQKDTPQVFALLDVVLASSRIEGLPLALLEGMAAGAIPVVFRVGGMPEVVSDPSVGWVVEAGDIPGFARAMGEVAALTREERETFSRRVVDYVRERFDLHATNGRIAELLEREYATIKRSA